MDNIVEECFWRAELAKIKEVEGMTQGGTITLGEWVDFVEKYVPKRHYDPRRARPL